ncbi:alpha-D-ribose 1-methylphosphonate 5-triphosphate diphosphatase [Mariprofundus sp. EBB-1]|uniref:alpha-D-ribose 1-methylphosphonate 5-triphosphate diphosphatase n=1 Tax=Mariprofundus sp. EBB-1 TaxID=2650971 RepID=UPI000EF1C7A1|nr:alpha-D-ribose 1-methylphosphonate 5-triphosphate diphosphatase [Mariprofundus sp. EBB-1]RLL52729.1 alpha-D-ribose 1-methylphosphonate 5-triphosphate diphosphatase [Mariprofundus sp. EBB-1]
MSQMYLTHARIILTNEVLEDASLLIKDGLIAAINPDNCASASEIDLKGKTIMPGMIDLHCDALEKEVEPRPGVHFPMNFAIAQADKRNAAAGITTVFHAMAFANNELGVRSNEMAAQLVSAVHAWQPHALVDNRVHCRYEITDVSGMPVLQSLLENKQMDLLSLMDHTPGQGQFKSMAAYREYLKRTYKRSESEVDDILEQKQAAAEGAFERVEYLIKLAHANGISVASHDDDSSERIDTMTALNVQISEFPINLETARYARQQGMSTIMGAPNILRGKSQSGSMRAIDGIHADVVDCLCADYAPAALIVAVFQIPEISELNLADAVRFVTANPAKAAGLHDRGEIAVGKRADLIAVDFPGGLPQVSSVWVDGVQACQNNYDHG